MPAIVSVLFWSILCAAIYALFAGVWIGALYLLRVKRKIRWAILSLPIFIAGLLAYNAYESRSSAVFEQLFGFSPPAEVRSLQSYEWGLGDSGGAYLKFNASVATLQRITARGLAPLKPNSGRPCITNVTPPGWWQPPPTAKPFIGIFDGRNYAFEEEYLLYDSVTGDVYFRAVGVD